MKEKISRRWKVEGRREKGEGNKKTNAQYRTPNIDKLVKSRIPMAKKKAQNSRRANPE
jgi:hypothetical protein